MHCVSFCACHVVFVCVFTLCSPDLWLCLCLCVYLSKPPTRASGPRSSEFRLRSDSIPRIRFGSIRYDFDPIRLASGCLNRLLGLGNILVCWALVCPRSDYLLITVTVATCFVGAVVVPAITDWHGALIKFAFTSTACCRWQITFIYRYRSFRFRI